MPLTLALAAERWPIAGSFAISRGAKTEAVVVVAELGDGKARGRGECVPYHRYGESVESIMTQINAMRSQLAAGLDRRALQTAMPPGAARNALDCAFWDLEAKRSGRPVHELAGLAAPHALTTAYTISLGPPAAMAEAAKAATRALLKIKLGGSDKHGGDAARIAAVRAAATKATIIVDANEGWDERTLSPNLAACAQASAHHRTSLAALVGKYDAVNIKLDKAGGLTEALAMAAEAERAGFAIMAGCMVATSLAMAPAMLLAQSAQYVDLDGALLLARDRRDGLIYRDSLVFPPAPALWG